MFFSIIIFFSYNVVRNKGELYTVHNHSITQIYIISIQKYHVDYELMDLKCFELLEVERVSRLECVYCCALNLALSHRSYVITARLNEYH